MTSIILTAALKGTIVLGMAGLAAMLLRRSSADLRHRIWLAALIAMALLLIPFPMPAPLRIAVTTGSGVGSVASAVSRSLPLLPIAWATVAALLLLRWFRGLAKLHFITRSARTAEGFQLSQAIDTPLTWGVFQPVILLPAYMEGWSTTQRDVVLQHERAHIERRDWLWQAFSESMIAVFWFHPLVWLAAAKLRQEAEHAADDRTLEGGVRAVDYADRLMAVARELQRSVPSEAVAMVRRPALTARVAAILDATRTRTGAGMRARVLILLATGAVLVPLTAYQNRTVYHVGNGVSSPTVVYKLDPAYTQEAKDAKIQGGVVVTAVVNTLGRADDIRVTRSLDPGLDAQAIAAVKQWLFKPGAKAGQTVDVAVTIEINFKLK